MTRLFLIIALVLVINRCHSLKLNEDEIDLFNSVGQQQINSGVKFPIDFKSYLPLDSAETKSTSSYSGVKWSDAPLNSDFLDQNFELKARKFDLDSSSATNINVLFGTQSNLWISGSVLKKIDLENDLLVDHFKPGSKLFINKFSPNIVIISEPIRKSINLSKNNGQSFSLKSTPFRPDILYFTPDEAIVLGAEAIDQHANDLWVSLNFGEKWIHLGKCDKSTPEWEKSKEISSIYYINENQQLVKLNLKDLTSDQDVSSRAQVVKNDVREFELVDNKFLFVTSLNNDMVLQILNLKNPAEFVTATFNFDKTPERIMDYNVVWADDYEILVAVYYDLNDKIRSDLFRTTDMKRFSFDLTLKNLAYNDKKFDLEVKILNKRGGVVLANVHSDENDYRMVKTMCRLTSDSNEWKEIKTTPELKQSHLDLNSAKFMFSHEYENSLIDDPKSPDFAISTVLGKNGEKLGTYESQSDASEWSLLNKGAHVSSYTNFGHILLSADQSRPVDELIFTLNKGVDWHRMKFADEAVLVNELLTVDPAKQDRLPRFVVIATSAKTGARLVFKIDAVRPQQNKSLPPDVSTEDKDDGDDDGDDECKQKCYNKLVPNQLICMRPQMICNGKVECMNDVDEFKCNSNVVENKPSKDNDDDDDDDDDDDEDDDIPSPLNRLSSVETSSSYEVKVRQAGFSKSAFTITYSLVRHGPSKVIYRPQVALYRLRDERENSGDAVTVDDATLQTKAKFVNVFKNDLLENTSERTIELEGLDLPGYIYVCVFLVDLDFKTYKLNDRLVFTHTGFITNLKSSSSYEYYFKLAEIAGVALFATICFVLFAFLLCRCCQRRRQIIDMKYQHIEKTKNRIFSRSTVAGCDNQPLTGFIEDGIYNPPSV